MSDTTQRLTVVTPDGEFAPGDPRAVQAIAAFVRSIASRNLDQARVDKLNKTLVVVPVEGVCLACQRRLPLFLYRCEHWADFGFSHAHQFWLCTRDHSRAEELAQDDRNPCSEMTSLDYDGFDPFTAPTPGTLAWKLAHGPIAGPIRSHSPNGGAR